MTGCTSGSQEVAEVIKLFVLCWSALIVFYAYHTWNLHFVKGITGGYNLSWGLKRIEVAYTS